jgi:hypothetical protein
MTRVFGWLFLLGRGRVPEDGEIMVLRDEVAVFRRLAPPSHPARAGLGWPERSWPRWPGCCPPGCALARRIGKDKAQVAVGATQLRIYHALLSAPARAIATSAPTTTRKRAQAMRKIRHHLAGLDAHGYDVTLTPGQARMTAARSRTDYSQPPGPPTLSCRRRIDHRRRQLPTARLSTIFRVSR